MVLKTMPASEGDRQDQDADRGKIGQGSLGLLQVHMKDIN